jgi:RNA polymerase sigma-B factor
MAVADTTTMGRRAKATTRRRERRRARSGGPGQPTDKPRVDPRFAEYRRTGEHGIRNQLVLDHRWVAVHCVRRFTGKGEPTDDLTQVAMLGLIKAVERFNPAYGVVFTTFAIPSIMGELRRHFRDKTWAVHVPRRAKELHQLVNDATAELTHTLGRSPTIPEIADHAGISVEDTLGALEAGACYRGVSLTPSNDDGPNDSPPIGRPDPGFDATDARLTVADVIHVLPEREQHIVKLRFVDRLTQTQIAEQIGVSQVQVSRLLRASLEKMRRKLAAGNAS